jgi:hypothetical protein
MINQDDYEAAKSFIPVVSASGGSGKFISTLIGYSANNLDIPEYPNKRTTHFHTEAEDFKVAYLNLEQHEPPPPNVPYWEYIKVKKGCPVHTATFAGGTFRPASLSALDIMYPDWRMLIITIKPEDLLTIELNHIWKMDLKPYIQGTEYESQYTSAWRQQFAPETVKEIVEKYMASQSYQFLNTIYYDKVNIWYNVLRSNFQEKVFRINFADIVGNPEVVIDTLEQLTRNTFTPNMLSAYSNYVNLQIDHYKEHMPWHPILQNNPNVK